jgi:hypothetical protein
MSQQNFTHTLFSSSLKSRMITGASIALALILLFLFGAEESDPSWSRYWILRPLVIVPLAGAAGGLFYDFMANLASAGWKKVLAIAVGSISFIIALWIGSVLGLAGYYWH